MLTSAVARYLASKGHGTYDVAGATIRLEELGSGDGVAVGYKPTSTSELGGYDLVGVQVIVRKSSTSGGRTRVGFEDAQAIRDDLNGLRHITLGVGSVDEVRLVWMLSDDSGPLNLGDDANGVPRWSLRFNALVPNLTPLSLD